MNKSVEKGKVLLVSGPASVTLVEGNVTLLGAGLSRGNKVVVRKGKTAPFEAEENSILNVILGVEAQVEEVIGSTIPNSWKKVAEEILSWPKPCTTVVLGDLDCGKTSFCTFLVNQALKLKLRPAIIDADLGQSDVGSPTTIGLSLISKPVTDLFSLEPDAIFFAGLTSPSGITERLITGIVSLNEKASEMATDIIIINTDGWVQGEDARNYKAALMRETLPQAVVGIQQNDEVERIFAYAEREGFKVFRLDLPPAVRKRDREERRELREQGYRKFLNGATLRSLPMSWVEFEYTPLGTGTSLNVNKLEELERVIGCRTLYCEENPKEVFIVSKDDGDISKENATKAEEVFKKKLYMVKDGEEKGLLVGLLDKDRQFLGLGMIYKIDYENRILKIYTPYKDKVSIIQFGQIKVDEKGKELGVTKAFSI